MRDTDEEFLQKLQLDDVLGDLLDLVAACVDEWVLRERVLRKQMLAGVHSIFRMLLKPEWEEGYRHRGF